MLSTLARLLAECAASFRRDATFSRTFAVLLVLLCGRGRRTVSSAIRHRPGRGRGWSRDYAVFSRAVWSADGVFGTVFKAALAQSVALDPAGPVVMAMDDTSFRKCGRKIAAAQWMRDPLSPAFHVNLRRGVRCLHSALILPFHASGGADGARAISVAFEIAPSVKFPRGELSVEGRADAKARVKAASLPTRAVAMIKEQRRRLDDAGGSQRSLLFGLDGGFTNRTVIAGLPARTDMVGRTRRDVALFKPAEPGGQRVYGDRLPTPDALRQDATVPWTTVQVHYGGQSRAVRYKEVPEVLWKEGGRRRLLRLLVVAPTSYRAPGGGRKLDYRQPAYLLATDLKSSAVVLLQAYFDRWQIECVHRDLKQYAGVADPQVHSPKAFARIHRSIVATWSMVQLAAMAASGPSRTDAYPSLAAWRKREPPRRPSAPDILARLREEIAGLQLTRTPSPPTAAPPPGRRPPGRKPRPQLENVVNRPLESNVVS